MGEIGVEVWGWGIGKGRKLAKLLIGIYVWSFGEAQGEMGRGGGGVVWLVSCRGLLASFFASCCL